MRYFLQCFAFVSLATGQTTPSIIAITNGALPGMDAHVPVRLQPRSMATIFGSNLSTATASTTPPWVTTLGGIQVHLVPLYTGCGTANPPANLSCELIANLIYVSPIQINFIVPDVLPSAYGQQELVVDVILLQSGQRLDTHYSFSISPVGDFAVFQVGYDCDFSLSLSYPDACGYSGAPGQNKVPIGAVTDVSGTLVTSQNPIHQGNIIILWATGIPGLSLDTTTGLLQQQNPDPMTFGIAQSNQNSANNVLNQDWKVQTPLWAGESPQYVGLDQINLIFPSCAGAAATTEQRYDIILSFHAPSADSNLGIGFATLYMPFLIGPGEATCQFGATTTTTLTSSANPSVAGQSLTLTASVSASDATGTVTFFDGTSTLGVGTLAGGKATCGTASACSTSGLGAGSHSVTATYNGDSTYAGSSATLNQMVTLNTNVTLTSSANPATFGVSLTFTATISPCCIATGTVTFLDGSTTIGSGPLVAANGAIQATVSTSGLSVGTHSITAHYNGDNYDNASSSPVLTQAVTIGTLALSITYSPSTVVAGQAVTFTVRLSNNGATGTITLFDGTATIGTTKVSNGQATFSASLSSGGSHTITADYSGDSNFNSTFASITVTVTVNKTPTSITITSSTSRSAYSASDGSVNVTFTATVSPNCQCSNGSTVMFYATNKAEGNNPWCYSTDYPGGYCQVLFCNNSSGYISNGKATCSVTGGLVPGTSSVIAVYSGDSNYLGSTSSAITEVVSMPLYSFYSPSVLGQAVSFEVVTGWPFSSGGIVTFYDGTTVLGVAVVSTPVSSPINNYGFYFGVASFQTASLAVGSHSITASFSPSPGVVAATTAVLTQVVTAH
jgi:uncharacterized protein (TIGR03437 family)